MLASANIIFVIFLIVLYFHIRSIWVTKNLRRVMEDISNYLVKRGIPKIQKNTGYDIDLYIHSFFNQPSMQYYYWMFRKPFCYDIKKIIYKIYYDEIYPGGHKC